MKLDRYHLEADDPFTTFYFTSEGPKGKISKVVQFTSFSESSFYNLAMGDYNPATGEIDDMVVTDNGDSEKVLATVVGAVYNFCEHFPSAWVYAAGSTPSRNRLYRMGINRYYEIANEHFILLGETENDWEPYVKGKEYSAFIIQRKLVDLDYEKQNAS